MEVSSCTAMLAEKQQLTRVLNCGVRPSWRSGDSTRVRNGTEARSKVITRLYGFSGSGEQALEIGAFLEADRVVQRVPGAFDFAQRPAGSFGSLMDGREKPVRAYPAGTGS